MERDLFANLSPLDHRYYLAHRELMDRLSLYLSEEAMVRYELRVEAALAQGLAEAGVCSPAAAAQIASACQKVRPAEVYAEEERTQHHTRALVNCIRQRVDEEARPFVHLTATSFDIVDTANALRYREVTEEVLVPLLWDLERVLLELARREKGTVQIGRTHGQFALPITFGFALAGYVERLGKRILEIEQRGRDLRGKLSGAVGAYNAAALFVPDPRVLEERVLARLGLRPSPYSSQIVEAEYLVDYLHALVTCFGVLANLADDLRHLQRSEIGEVGEYFAPEQVGSSTMPHKRNPWNFEHIKSLWKAFMPRMATAYSDQISEHQRDLTNSASARFVPEMIAGLALAADRARAVLSRLAVDRAAMQANFAAAREMIIAEPLYLLLAFYGHPDAHEAVRRLTLEAERTGRTLRQLLPHQSELAPYLSRLTPEQRRILDDPASYLGLAVQRTEEICARWEQLLSRSGEEKGEGRR
ncbi:MAG: lyase family protein [Bacillota bacterium]|nr:lyase family protein [Bacillota bacterium]